MTQKILTFPDFLPLLSLVRFLLSEISLLATEGTVDWLRSMELPQNGQYAPLSGSFFPQFVQNIYLSSIQNVERSRQLFKAHISALFCFSFLSFLPTHTTKFAYAYDSYKRQPPYALLVAKEVPYATCAQNVAGLSRTDSNGIYNSYYLHFFLLIVTSQQLQHILLQAQY